MKPNVIHFVSLFATLLAIINPLEAIPVFLHLLQGKNRDEHRRVARKACLYALLLMVFFLLFGTVLLKVFGVSLNILSKIGPKGIDAASRIIGFFVSAMGMGLFLNGLVGFLQSYGIMGSQVVDQAP